MSIIAEKLSVADLLCQCAEEADGWCSVKDELPKVPGYYQIYDKYDKRPKTVFFHIIPEHLTSGKYKEITQYFGDVAQYAAGRITHWRPLPKPPKEAHHD